MGRNDKLPNTLLVRETPEPFARRNILCGNRLHQNKYEMSAWVQEARAMGSPAQAKSGATLGSKKSAFMACKRGDVLALIGRDSGQDQLAHAGRPHVQRR